MMVSYRSILQHIKEADGTTGQNTDIGSGVKTGHIQDGAVTPSKIGFYRNVRVVAKSGGDFTDPVAAMNSITDASATNPYLVKIMPGVYDIGANSVQMKEYVDIEGSGENTTVITGSNLLRTIDPCNGLVNGASNSEIRFLTIENTTTGFPNTVVAMCNYNASPKISNVTVNASGDANVWGIINSGESSSIITEVTVNVSGGYGKYGIANFSNSSPRITNVSVWASGNTSNIGINILAASVVMSNVTVSSVGGTSNIAVYNNQGTVKIDHSELTGSSNIVFTVYGAKSYIANTKLDGGPTYTPPTNLIKCLNVYDGDYNPITCP